MKFTHHAAAAFHNLYQAKLRALLAVLGILVGTASVVAMVLGGELATRQALQEFKSLGTDLFAITLNAAADANSDTAGKSQVLSLPQSNGLITADANILQVAPYTQIYHPLYYRGKTINGTVLGVTHTFAEIIHLQLQAGRFISPADHYEFYCVIGQEIYQALKNISQQEPLGQHLQIGNNIFLIIGIAKAWPENSFIYANVDHAILVPLLASTLLSEYALIQNVLLRLQENANLGKVEQHIRHYLTPLLGDKPLTVRSAKVLLAKMHKQNNILTLFLGLIGSISLLVGGIGVMNIMLVSVLERRREIGIRLAVGATRMDIGKLFLAEAVLLAGIGGSAGVIMGVGITYLLATLWHWQFVWIGWPPAVGFSVSVAVGIFFGFYPAYQAACLQPIDALRIE